MRPTVRLSWIFNEDIPESDIGADMPVYRAWKMEWIGRPPWGPSIASSAPGDDGSDVSIYVSWNGDTLVHHWEVYAGEDEKNVTSSPRLLANSSRVGFETEIGLEGLGLWLPKTARAIAVSKSGKTLGSTAIVDLASGKLNGNSSSIWKLKPQPFDKEPSGRPDSKKKPDDEEDTASQAKPCVSSLFALLLAIAFISF
ncbi:hypothetical protein NW766_002743 [Fusarium irregulare]|uniref:Uncharacterized protein n=1 Tax=Fusarium irregulare TaxID=2494466 RepID=A0A9W8PXA3_9HYPO|nr:hypothetical protein NW766_002743 [Fusarium irregulare]